MGSGVSGNYSGTIEKSQPFAESYEVTGELLKRDMCDPEIYDPITGYFKNPTAVKLDDAIINGNVYLDGKRANGVVTYVINIKGELIFGKRSNPNNPNKRAPHPTLIGGRSPKVRCAGMITFSGGKIVSVDNRSGHFKPNIRSMKYVDMALEKIHEKHPTVFSTKSNWRKNQ